MSNVNTGSKKVLVAMSGGVDSSVTAALLKSQGYSVVGVHMHLWDHGEENAVRIGGRCCSLSDSNDARRVCDQLEVPYFVVNAKDVFREKVVDYFVHEYIQRRTPNPCVQCNTHIKFNYLFQKADELGCDLIATGHYAQISKDQMTNLYYLHKGADPQKDQSYFLFGLTQKALARTLMPLGGLSKVLVRKLAEQFGLAVADKADSQEICFVGQEGYQAFIESVTTPVFRPRGVIRGVDGYAVGEHEGLHGYTIGQKKRIQLQGRSPEQLFVVAFDQKNNALIVGPEEYLYHKSLVANKVNWVHPVDEFHTLHCHAKIRSRHEGAPCSVDVFENGVVHVVFKEPQRAITPGQAIVFYDGEDVLGGAFIDSVAGQDKISPKQNLNIKPLAKPAAKA